MKAIVKGSINALARESGKSIAETFVNADCIVICDVSGSMAMQDSVDGRSRHEQASRELEELQNNLPGKIAVLAFASYTTFEPSGTLPQLGGGTDLAGALRFAKVADVPGMRFIVISDGQPNSESAALAVAKTYQNRIDVIYVGPETHPVGRDFLQDLARISGGITVTADRVKELGATVTKLLEVN